MKRILTSLTLAFFITLSSFGSITALAASVTVKTTDVKSITNTNATVYGNVAKTNGVTVKTAGIYFGESTSSMSKIEESVSESVNRTYENFNIWYDLNKYWGQLAPGTTYYWQAFATYDGSEYKGAVKSFTTTGSKPSASSPSIAAPSVNSGIICSHHDYDSRGYCATCGAEFELNLFSYSPSRTYYAAKNNVPVRNRPYAPEKIIRELSKGTSVTVIGSVTNSVGNIWYQLNDGTYIFIDNLTNVSPASPPAGNNPPANDTPSSDGDYWDGFIDEDYNDYDYEDWISVTSVTVKPVATNIDIGQTVQLTANVKPDNATYQDVVWESSNPSIASVNSNGKVTALKAGSATIYAYSMDDNSVWSSCSIGVLSPQTQPAQTTPADTKYATPIYCGFAYREDISKMQNNGIETKFLTSRGSSCFYASYAMIITNLGITITPEDIHKYNGGQSGGTILGTSPKTYLSGTKSTTVANITKNVNVNISTGNKFDTSKYSSKETHAKALVKQYPQGILLRGTTPTGADHMVLAYYDQKNDRVVMHDPYYYTYKGVAMDKSRMGSWDKITSYVIVTLK